jgi:putative two-component system response regulator
MQSVESQASLGSDWAVAAACPPGGPAPSSSPAVGGETCVSRAATPATATVMIVDDEPVIIKIVKKYLGLAGYQNFVTMSDPVMAMEWLSREPPDVLLLDIVMPEISGLDILERVREHEHWRHIPVIVLTAADDERVRSRALELGATDFLAKPVNATELLPRVRNALLVKAHHDHLEHQAHDLEHQVRQRTAELLASRLELIHCLARVAEYRDNETGRHVIRVGRYAGIIARELGLDPETAELIEHAAPLHDIGKVGIPDAILLKPGKLTPDEMEIMQNHTAYGKRTFEPMPADEWGTVQSHTVMGQRILDVATSPLIAMASQIALTHHERWDGGGYPLGLSGESIPLCGRITAVADVFDALSSKRPYKPAFPLERCLAILEEGRGTHFDPRVLDAFFARHDDVVRIRIEYADTE